MNALAKASVDKRHRGIRPNEVKEYCKIFNFLCKEEREVQPYLYLEKLEKYSPFKIVTMKKYSEFDVDQNLMEKTTADGYPVYPAKEDIYSKDIHTDVDEDDLRSIKEEDLQRSTWNEKSFADDYSGDDLDVPGSELDNDLEDIGSEDEENNYYSLDDQDEIDLED